MHNKIEIIVNNQVLKIPGKYTIMLKKILAEKLNGVNEIEVDLSY